jgi:hypothetical protein
MLGLSGMLAAACLAAALAGSEDLIIRAHARPDVMGARLAELYDGFFWLRIGAIAMLTLAVALATGLCVAPGFRHLLTRRTVVSTLAVPLILSPSILLVGLCGVRAASALQLTVDPGDALAEQLAAEGFTAPRFDARLGRWVSKDRPRLRLTVSGMQLDGAALAPADLPDGPLSVLASPEVPLSQVHPFASRLAARSVTWPVQTPDGLRAFQGAPWVPVEERIDTSPPDPRLAEIPDRFAKLVVKRSEAPRLLAVQRDEGWVLFEDGAESGPIELGQAPTLAPLIEPAQMKDRSGRDVHVWFADGATVQDLMRVASLLHERSGVPDRIARDQPDLDLVWRVDAPPDLAAGGSVAR